MEHPASDLPFVSPPNSRGRWATWYQTAWAKLLLVAVVSIQSLLLSFLQPMQPIREHGVATASVLNLTPGLGQFFALGGAIGGAIFLFLAVLAFFSWFRET